MDKEVKFYGNVANLSAEEDIFKGMVHLQRKHLVGDPEHEYKGFIMEVGSFIRTGLKTYVVIIHDTELSALDINTAISNNYFYTNSGAIFKADTYKVVSKGHYLTTYKSAIKDLEERAKELLGTAAYVNEYGNIFIDHENDGFILSGGGYISL